MELQLICLIIPINGCELNYEDYNGYLMEIRAADLTDLSSRAQIIWQMTQRSGGARSDLDSCPLLNKCWGRNNCKHNGKERK